MRRLILLCVLAAGCLDFGDGSKHYDVNDCKTTALADARCATLHLTADPMMPDSTVTQVLMWVRYQESGVDRVVERTTNAIKPTRFPFAIGLVLPDGFDGDGQVDVEALNGPGPVAFDHALIIDAEPGMPVDIDVPMQRVGISPCFNGVFNSTDETDLDCGNNCPPCSSGLRCNGNLDCQSASCAFNDTFETEICN